MQKHFRGNRDTGIQWLLLLLAIFLITELTCNPTPAFSQSKFKKYDLLNDTTKFRSFNEFPADTVLWTKKKKKTQRTIYSDSLSHLHWDSSYTTSKNIIHSADTSFRIIAYDSLSYVKIGRAMKISYRHYFSYGWVTTMDEQDSVVYFRDGERFSGKVIFEWQAK